MVHRIGGGRADEREGGTKWSTEFEVEGLMRERGARKAEAVSLT